MARGQRVGGDFEIIRELGAGGMGSVYLARQLSTDALRALKVMRPRYQRDADFVRRFTQEARASARIKSRHVIEVIAAGVDETLKIPWLAMEYLEGKTLDDAMARFGVPTEREARVLLEQLFHAIACGHDARIVHRDLKPENVLLARAESPGIPFTLKVLDFGIAKWLAGDDAGATASLWTPLWGAPEQASPTGRVGPQADVWALGLLVFWLLTGETYWHAERDLQAIFKEIVADPLPFASARAHELGCSRRFPPAFDGWFARAVARVPTERFAHAREAGQALFEVGLPWPESTRPWRVEGSLEFAATEALGSQAPADLGAEPAAMLETRSAPPVSSTVPLPLRTSDHGATSNALVVAGRPPRTGQRRNALIALALVVTAGLVTGALRWPGRQSSLLARPAASTVGADSAASKLSPEPPSGMRFVPSGTFRVGPWQNDLGDTRLVSTGQSEATSALGRPYFIDALEVDVGAYHACVRAGACSESITGDLSFASLCNAGHSERERHPINCVNRLQARSYCRWVGKRLPSETEWERAARGGDGRLYPWGNQPPRACEMAVVSPLCDRAPAPTRATGSRDPASVSPFGVADLSGNVWEWVEDSWKDEPGHMPSLDPLERNDSGFGVLRGGSWDHAPDRASATTRLRAPETRADVGFGFRCASSAPSAAEPP